MMNDWMVYHTTIRVDKDVYEQCRFVHLDHEITNASLVSFMHDTASNTSLKFENR